MHKEVEDLDDDELEDGDDSGTESSHSHSADDMKCPKCEKQVNKTELVHPVVLNFNSDANLVVFFHDPCYKLCSSAEVERLVRDVKYELMLSSPDDADLHHC